jgi:hypothetical protein
MCGGHGGVIRAGVVGRAVVRFGHQALWARRATIVG